MRDIQARIIEELHVEPVVDPADQVRRRVDFLKEYLAASGAKGLVLGISGGQDSSLAGRLCRLAVEELAADGRPSRFVAVRLPYGVQRDEADAQLALDFIGPAEVVDFNIAQGVDGLAAEYADAVGAPISDFGKGNVKARMRMVAQYALAGERGLLVVGTDHAAVGFCDPELHSVVTSQAREERIGYVGVDGFAERLVYHGTHRTHLLL